MMDNSDNVYVSFIKINGRSILPPVLDERKREEMRQYRELAISVGLRIEERKVLQPETPITSPTLTTSTDLNQYLDTTLETSPDSTNKTTGRLIRSASYTLDRPSAMLLASFDREDSLAVPEKPQTVRKPSKKVITTKKPKLKASSRLKKKPSSGKGKNTKNTNNESDLLFSDEDLHFDLHLDVPMDILESCMNEEQTQNENLFTHLDTQMVQDFQDLINFDDDEKLKNDSVINDLFKIPLSEFIQMDNDSKKEDSSSLETVLDCKYLTSSLTQTDFESVEIGVQASPINISATSTTQTELINEEKSPSKASATQTDTISPNSSVSLADFETDCRSTTSMTQTDFSPPKNPQQNVLEWSAVLKASGTQTDLLLVPDQEVFMNSKNSTSQTDVSLNDSILQTNSVSVFDEHKILSFSKVSRATTTQTDLSSSSVSPDESLIEDEIRKISPSPVNGFDFIQSDYDKKLNDLLRQQEQQKLKLKQQFLQQQDLLIQQLSTSTPLLMASSSRSKSPPIRETASLTPRTKAIPSEVVKKLSRLPALVRGYLTRRLMKTERVQNIKSTMSEALTLAMQLHQCKPTETDIALHGRLLQQVNQGLKDFHHLFCSLPVSKHMEIIALDRARLKRAASAAMRSSSRLSEASLKSQQRRQQHKTNSMSKSADFTPSRPLSSRRYRHFQYSNQAGGDLTNGDSISTRERKHSDRRTSLPKDKTPWR